MNVYYNPISGQEMRVIEGEQQDNLYRMPRLNVIDGRKARQERLRKEREETQRVLTEVDKKLAEIDMRYF